MGKGKARFAEKAKQAAESGPSSKKAKSPKKTQLGARTKIEKRKMKHTALMKKLHVTAGKMKKQKDIDKHGAALATTASSLADALNDFEVQMVAKRAAAPSAVKLSATTGKSRQRLAAAEMSQFAAVLSHPAFVAEPIATIQEHLRNSIARSSQVAQPDSSNRERKQRRRRLKQSQQPADMLMD